MHNETEPHHKDHDAPRGGLKLHASFATDPMGRNTMQLVCPELRRIDADSAEGFLDITRDEVHRIIRAHTLDCHILPPKEGYKKDRLVITGTNEDLQIIQNAIYRTQTMSDGNDTPTLRHSGHAARVSAHEPLRGSVVGTLISNKATVGLLNQLRKNEKCEGTIYMQIDGAQAYKDADRNVGGRTKNTFESIDREAFGQGRDFKREMSEEMKALGIIKLTGSMDNLAWAVSKFGEACGKDVDDLQSHAASIVERNNTKGR